MAVPLEEFITDFHVRLTWIAFFTLWVLWGLVYTIRFILGENNKPTPQADAEAGATTSEKKTWNQGGFVGRLRNAHQVLFENTLLLLSVLVLNTLATGSTRAVMILAWIFFAFTVVHAFTEIGVEHRFVRLAFTLVFYGVTLAIGGLAFAQGF
ncbi:uncharacterized protein BX664DRAFT_273562 [Halteromyces radiatus]|uniref:uncharacterized protein n=1 Tax=Halteromyces radiatus TaxID=101107 RepID=UPI00222114F2|nr:uncharacterized protein BX664DRAFT_273562 [Halteromyces radiatus]KAI8099976.1 hypothetical protein BX664DRAFT_273562 [Halteromyces radiatus]